MTKCDSLQTLRQELKEPFETKGDCINLTCNWKIRTDRNWHDCDI